MGDVVKSKILLTVDAFSSGEVTHVFHCEQEQGFTFKGVLEKIEGIHGFDMQAVVATTYSKWVLG